MASGVIKKNAWTYLGTKTDTSQLSLPSSFSNILVRTIDGDGYYFSTYITRDQLLDTDNPYFLTSKGAFRISRTMVKKVNGNEIRVYYN